MARLFRAASDRNPPTSGEGGCQAVLFALSARPGRGCSLPVACGLGMHKIVQSTGSNLSGLTVRSRRGV